MFVLLLLLLLTAVVVADGGADVVERTIPAQAETMAESFMIYCCWLFVLVVVVVL